MWKSQSCCGVAIGCYFTEVLKMLMFDRGIGTRIGGTLSVFLQNIYYLNLGK